MISGLFGGHSIDDKMLAEIRSMSQQDKATAIHTALVENDSANKSLWAASQREAAFRMLEALVDNRRTSISSGEIKAIIRMSKDCW